MRVNGMSKKARWLLIGGGIAASIALFTLMGLNEQAAIQRDLAASRSSARAEGVPLTVDEMRTKVGAVDDPQNAWPIYVEAIRTYAPATFDEAAMEEGDLALRQAVYAVSDAIGFWRRGNRNWDYDLFHGQVEAVIAPILDAAQKASERPLLRPEREWEKGHLLALPELREIGRFSRLLVYDAMRAHDAGDLDRCERRLSAIVNIALQLWQVPMAGYPMTGIDVARDAMALVRTLVSVRQVPYSDAMRLIRQLDPILVVPDLKASFGSIVFCGLTTLNLLNSPDHVKKAELEARIVRRNPPRPELRQQIELEFLQAANRILADWPKDPADLEGIRIALGEDDAKMNLSLGLFSRFMRQTVGNDPDEGLFKRTLVPFEAHLARVRLMKILAAALTERHATGRFPAALPALGDDAIDPFSGKPMRYITDYDRTGLRVYSFGMDREDNEGSRPRVEDGVADIVMAYPDRRSGW